MFKMSWTLSCQSQMIFVSFKKDFTGSTFQSHILSPSGVWWSGGGGGGSGGGVCAYVCVCVGLSLATLQKG